MKPARVLGVAAALGAVLSARAARADLAKDAERLAAAWFAERWRVLHLEPTFVEHGRPHAVRVPPAALDATQPGCTSVAFLTGRAVEFVVRSEAGGVPRTGAGAAGGERSAAGTAVVTRCGGARWELGRLFVELRPARAAFEVLVVQGDTAVPPVPTVLPERESGPLGARVDVGTPAPLGPLPGRVEQVAARARTEGAKPVRTNALTADDEGAGSAHVVLEDGCHRLELLAAQAPGRRVDVDADVRDSLTGRLLGRDRSEAPDARIELCVGDPTAVDVAFAGAPPGAPVVLSDARFPIAAGIPAHWGARARAGLAAALRRRRVPPPPRPPVAQILGVPGPTATTVDVEPSTCYAAAVAAIRGEARGIALGVRGGGPAAVPSTDAAHGGQDAVAVAFCTDASERARVDVDVRGGATLWVLAVWRVGARAPGEASP